MSAFDPKRTLDLSPTRSRNLTAAQSKVEILQPDAAWESIDVAKFSMTNFAASCGIICCTTLSFLSFPGLGLARDPDGKYKVS
jgi:hypothetical protein